MILSFEMFGMVEEHMTLKKDFVDDFCSRKDHLKDLVHDGNHFDLSLEKAQIQPEYFSEVACSLPSQRQKGFVMEVVEVALA